MAYFPFYVELKDVSVLIVGGGKVALHKVKRILDYGLGMGIRDISGRMASGI